MVTAAGPAVAVAVVLGGVLVALVLGASRPRPAARAGWLAAAVAFGVAAASAVAVWQHGPAPTGGPLVADRISVSLLMLVCGVSAVVQAFAVRYLTGDPRQRWFVAWAGVLTAGSAVLVTASTLLVLAAAWTVAGVALVQLLNTYPAMPAARDGVRRAARAFAVGDLALWAAVAIAVVRWGELDLRLLAAGPAAGDPALPVVAVLIVVAALSRSAQVPLHRWLPASLAAPTPVSALLHAGVVNAGGVLLVRLNPVVGLSAAAMWLAVAAGAVTAVYGTTVMLTKPDVKGALAWSTTGQMGFMIMTCGLGLPAVAMLHLVGHGLYKATLFLGSGSVVRRGLRHAAAPPAPPLSVARRAGAVVVAAALPAVILAAASAVRPVAASLVVFVWATAAAATYGLLRRGPTPRAVAAASVAVAVALPAYLVGAAAAHTAWTPAGAIGGPAGSAWAVVAVLGALLGVAAVRSGRWPDAARTLYAWAMSASHVGPQARRRGRGPVPAADLSGSFAWGVQS
ncbi:hypothetical protein GCM10020358_50450 [Amorphoplanes nipponensis]|uniref:NAD(P)H-quinone oxidoreductase subunit 5 n=1 Tax=Actinoplanes nipponensis TaxID=135950 RepID=A0A919MFE6_9ACTN|nr:proton-conducting transporter membrane subunit [Actinoplanes nipponensis]GIE47449.1 hypothetical protein Ani05nite_09830 [Actinoplanes nipponensis]